MGEPQVTCDGSRSQCEQTVSELRRALAERDEAMRCLGIIGERKDAAEARAEALAALVREIYDHGVVWIDGPDGNAREAEWLARARALLGKDGE